MQEPASQVEIKSDWTQSFATVQYTEASRYFIEVVKFRFTLLSFFVFGAVVAMANAKSWWHFLLILVIATGLWIIEFRTRMLYRELSLFGEAEERGNGYKDR